MATHSLLSAIEAAGTTNNHAVIKQLEKLKVSAVDRMQHHDAWMNPNTHQMQQTVYLATANLGDSDKDDLFTILSNSKPMTVADAGADAACKLESFEETPVYEP
jgi:branched-chain amino acid transport system substrate-binding protein